MVLNIKRASSLDEPSTSVDVLCSPFIHQVSGHTAFTALPDGHLLKPCAERELLFYEQLPAHVKPIVPSCCSTIHEEQVNCLENCCHLCRQMQLVVLIPKCMESSPFLKNRKLSRHFISLSDLTYGLRSPRILDLKLGTRQHGDQATDTKIAGMMAKCQSSTSASLGIRMCGMKYFDRRHNQYVMIDKYEGRSMNEASLFKAIKAFFDVDAEQIEKVREELFKIHRILLTSPGLRLFGASLLIVLDDDEFGQPRVKIIDFANATFPGFLNDNLYEGVDEGSIMGIETVLRFLDRSFC